MKPYFRIFSLILLIIYLSTSLAYGELVNPENDEQISAAYDREVNRIQPYKKNQAYWQYRGEHVLLVGGSSNDNLFQIEDLIDELDKLIEYGGNYIRNTMSSRDDGNEYPFFFNDEIQMYDLQSWNEAYWNKFEAFLQATNEREIIVQIEIWATYDFYSRPAHVLDGQTAWERNPFNPRNNINYTERNSGLYERFRSTHGTLINPFFHTVLPLPEPFDFEVKPRVLQYQQRFVDRLMDISLEYDNVLYVIDNETNADPKWPRYWSQYINKYASDRDKKIEVTEIWDTFDPTDGAVEGADVQNPHTHFFTRRASVSNTLYDPDNYSYLDISNHNFQTGEMHYKTGLYVWNEVQKSGIIRPINNTKIYGADDIGWATHQEGAERFWRNIFSGAASVRFHRPPYGLGNRDIALQHIRSMREFSDAIDITQVIPRNDLLIDRNENEAFCLAKEGFTYAVVFLDGGDLHLDVSEMQEAEIKLRWMNVRSSEWSEQVINLNGDTIHLKTPEDEGFWVVVLT